MKSFLLASSLVLSALAAGFLGCGAADPTVGDEDDLTAGACKVTGLTAAKQKVADDPFATLVLSAGDGGCPNTVEKVLARLKATAGASDKVFVVSEHADEAKKTTDYRFVIAQPSKDAGAETLLLSTLGSPEGGVAQDFLEVMSFSKSKKAYLYYALGGGKWSLKGDGSSVVPGKKPSFACVSCHTSGGPNFKELQLPWNNWNSFSFTMPSPPSQDPSFAALFDRKSGGESFEGIMVTGHKTWAKSRADAALSGKVAGLSLKTLMRSVMCEVAEPNLISSKSKHTKRFDPIQPAASLNVPPSMLVNQVLSAAGEVGYGGLVNMSISKLSSVSVKGSDYLAALKASGQTVDGAAGDTIFGLFVPERGFADNMIIEELLRRNLLTKDTVTDLLSADFTNPVFSKERCALAETAPDAAADAETLRTAWITQLATSKLAGAAALSARLADVNDFTKNQGAIDTFVTACANRATSDGAGFAMDIAKLASQRRREFIAQYGSLVESEALLPDDTLSDAKPNAFRLSATTCKLEKQ